MKKRGTGISCFYLGIGFAGKPNPSAATVKLKEDGTFEVLCSIAEIGQGTSTILCQIAANEIGVETEKVYLLYDDTDKATDAGTTAASRQTFISGTSVKEAAARIKEKIFAIAALILGVPPGTGMIAGDEIFLDHQPSAKIRLPDLARFAAREGILPVSTASYDPPVVPLDPETGEGVPYATYSTGLMIAEVEVDLSTGEIVVERLVCIADVGKAINPLAVEGQIEGGAVMGLGYTLMEKVELQNGAVLAEGFEDYHIPTSLDVPEITSIITETPGEHGPYGARGMGELPVVGVAPAILAAVKQATGIQVKNLPLTPAMIYELSVGK